MGRTGIAIVGCGNIANVYAGDLVRYPEVELIGVQDLDLDRARALAEAYSCTAFTTLDELLADDRVALVVNLTIHHAHFETTRRCLEAGKHVHSEKPLALNPEEAWSLVQLAERKGLRLGSSPVTWMGEAQQTAWKKIREGEIGDVRLIYAEVNHGRIETWHPNPAPFYAVGPFFDVGVYPLTLMTAFFGPVRKVTAVARVLQAERTTEAGEPFHVTAPDCVITLLELEGGQLARLTTNFYVHDTCQRGIEFHGSEGSLHLDNWLRFDSKVSLCKYGKGLEETPLIRSSPGREKPEYSRAIQELAKALEAGRPHRATGAHAAHVVDVLASAMTSSRTGCAVEVTSSFPPCRPMEWAE